MQSIAERHKYILDSLQRNGFVRLSDLAAELGVTMVTIRKDVKALEQEGLLYKVHGSARRADPHVSDLELDTKESINRDVKHDIGRKAVELINDNDSIIVASGSTIYAFMEELLANPRKNLNVVTPFLRLGILFAGSENVHVVQLGGSVHRKSLSVLGEKASKDLEDCICSKVFFGVDGLDMEHGVTTSTIEEAQLTRNMMKSASCSVILADSSKFGKRGFGRICGLEDIDVVVTDSGISEKMKAVLEDAGIDLIII